MTIRLRNVLTGVVVSVREGKRLGGEWEPVVAPTLPPEPARPTRRRTAAKS